MFETESVRPFWYKNWSEGREGGMAPWLSQWLRPCNDCMNKVKNIDISNDALLVTADIVALYPSIPHPTK